MKNYEKIALDVIREIGYTEKYKVIIQVSKQSQEINNAVMKDELGAGDQGIMFGYATNETEEYMPLPILLANKLTYQLAKVRKQDKNTPLKPDGKSQVTVEYVDNVPKRIDTIVEKKTEELIKQIFGKQSPEFDYKNDKGESTPDKKQKTFTAREIAEIITGGN